MLGHKQASLLGLRWEKFGRRGLRRRRGRRDCTRFRHGFLCDFRSLPLHFGPFTDHMFLTGANENQKNERGKNDAVPQQELHKRRHSNGQFTRCARRKSGVKGQKSEIRDQRSRDARS
jgi:hypothetical protein